MSTVIKGVANSIFNNDTYSAGGGTVIGTTTYTHTYTGLTIGKKYLISYQSFVSKTGGSLTADISASITGASSTWGGLTTVGRQTYVVATGEIYVFASWIMVTATATTITINVNGTFTGSGMPNFYDIGTTLEKKN
jgi:hypothetical protein